MLDHVTIRVSDLDASVRFYTVALGEPSYNSLGPEWDAFSLLPDEHTTKRLHVAFGVPTRDDVDAWWGRLVDAGYASDGDPGRSTATPTTARSCSTRMVSCNH